MECSHYNVKFSKRGYSGECGGCGEKMIMPLTKEDLERLRKLPGWDDIERAVFTGGPR